MAQLTAWTCEVVRAALGPTPWQLLGTGGQGSVFACVLDGARVAVKHLEGNSVSSLDDDQAVLARVRHDNVVRLLGYVRRARAATRPCTPPARLRQARAAGQACSCVQVHA